MIVMYLVAAVLLINGNRLKIDKGLIDGLQEEDRGWLSYSLMVNNEQKWVETVDCTVVEIDDSTAVVELSRPAQVRNGYVVRFALPADRAAPKSLLKLGRQRLAERRFDSALRYFNRIRVTLPDDPLVKAMIQEAETARKEHADREEELKKVNYYLSESARVLKAEEHELAMAWVERVLRVAPDNARGIELKRFIQQDVKRHETMIKVKAGKFQIGVDRAHARFYNQQPHFTMELSSFWIDRDSSGKTIVTFDEAEEYCRHQGKRLPTEFELEVASFQPGFRASGFAEWTTSWYLPYPGNQMQEEQYGHKYRVIRGPEDLRVRTFLEPGERAVDTSFRCACNLVPIPGQEQPE